MLQSVVPQRHLRQQRINNSNNSNIKEIVIPFGKYKGMKLKELNTPKDAVYLHWIS